VQTAQNNNIIKEPKSININKFINIFSNDGNWETKLLLKHIPEYNFKSVPRVRTQKNLKKNKLLMVVLW
jgi:hypothetical protein